MTRTALLLSMLLPFVVEECGVAALSFRKVQSTAKRVATRVTAPKSLSTRQPIERQSIQVTQTESGTVAMATEQQETEQPETEIVNVATEEPTLGGDSIAFVKPEKNRDYLDAKAAAFAKDVEKFLEDERVQEVSTKATDAATKATFVAKEVVGGVFGVLGAKLKEMKEEKEMKQKEMEASSVVEENEELPVPEETMMKDFSEEDSKEEKVEEVVMDTTSEGEQLQETTTKDAKQVIFS